MKKTLWKINFTAQWYTVSGAPQTQERTVYVAATAGIEQMVARLRESIEGQNERVQTVHYAVAMGDVWIEPLPTKCTECAGLGNQ